MVQDSSTKTNVKLSLKPDQFYMTKGHPCPYLEGLTERKVFTLLPDQDQQESNVFYTEIGFRRNGDLMYKPYCENCSACQSLRILCAQFKPSKSQKKILSHSPSFVATTALKQPSQKHYQLFQTYIKSRHQSSEMKDMTFDEFAQMAGTDHSYYLDIYEDFTKEKLIGSLIYDLYRTGASAVYSFFDPSSEFHKHSLGTFMILKLIELCQKQNLPYLYLGYYVKGCGQMSYKSHFKPAEIFLADSAWTKF